MNRINLIFLFITLTTVCTNVFAQFRQWESVVVPGQPWMYTIPNGANADWTVLNFDDSSWLEGNSGIGYGDNDDNTVISPTVALFMRKKFEIQDLSLISRAVLDIDYDDGFVAYINGVEVARDLFSGDHTSYSMTSDGYHEAQLYSGNVPKRYFFDKTVLNNGSNIIAIQVHNQALSSSDMSALPVISLELPQGSETYLAPPYWFQEPNPEPVDINFQSSNLPIVILDTNGNDIPTEPKIPATIKIIKRPNNERNYMSDVNNSDYIDFEGSIQIEIRGASSTIFSKKQYAFTTFDESGNKDNVKLLGMPKENDWILNGIAFDTLFMRDFLSYKLSNLVGQYASEVHYCELVLNDEYKGIYMLLEKLKADDSRINIKKISQNDNELPNLTGGYIVKSDKIEGEEILAWELPNYGGYNNQYALEHPSPDEITSEQHNYIENIFRELDDKSLNPNIAFSESYQSLIDIPSFVDFILLNELASNADAYQFSTFFHKDRRGKLRAGPIWDFNLTYGNDLFWWGFDRSKYDVWQLTYGNLGSKFWQNLWTDPLFNCYLAKRWGELTSSGQPLSENEIFELINQIASLITEAVNRQALQWGVNVEFDNRINNLKSFISQRINWLSSELNDTSLCDQISTPPLVISKIHYHPPQSDDGDYEFIEITNNSSTTLNTTGVYFGGLGLSYQFPPGSSIMPNQSVILANNADVFSSLYGFFPYDEFSRKLSNNSEEIKLLDSFGNLIDLVKYNDDAPWPTAADGDGAFLVLNSLSDDNSIGSNWSASLDYNTLTVSENIDNQLFVYPNPFTNFVYVSLTNGKVIEKINVYNLTGKLVSSFNSERSRELFSLTNIPVGIYFIEVISGSNFYSKQIIKK